LKIKSKIQWGVTWLAMGMLKRSLRYRVSGESAGWLQNIPVKNVSIFNRVDFIVEQCRNKNVLHIGFTDYPFTRQRISDGILLHQKIKLVTKSLLGLDNSSTALDEYCSATGDVNVIMGDITDHYPFEALDFNPELILLSEVLEHLANPASAVDILYNSFKDGTKVLVTVPNYTALDSLASSLHQTEGIHPDHHWYFSPYTLCKIFDDKRFRLEQLHFGMYYLQHTIINPILKQYPFNGDCIMAIFSITKNGLL
jgi:hypothetical protein